jgi:phosphoribosyl 1,2-cyclic phosphate phosphodiesterase
VEITVLGSGTSHGIPVITCDCAVCRSPDRRDRRRRSSIYVEGSGGEKIVVDTGCDFRMQALEAGITRLDALLLTHAHADHLHGLDDIRPLTWDGAVPVYGAAETLADLRARFDYIFKDTQRGGGKPKIELFPVSAPFRVGRVNVRPLPIEHGILTIFGYIFDEGGAKAAYITDCSALPGSPANPPPNQNCCGRAAASSGNTAADSNGTDGDSFSFVKQCEILILGALREKAHPTHFNFEQALALVRALCGTPPGERNLRQVYFTHISHETSHHNIAQYCAAWLKKEGITGLAIAPAYDTLHIRF